MSAKCDKYSSNTKWWVVILSSILSGIIVGAFTLIGVGMSYQKENETKIEFEKKYKVYGEILETFWNLAVVMPDEFKNYETYNKQRKEYLEKYINDFKSNELAVLIALYASDDVCRLINKIFEDGSIDKEEILNLSLQMRKEIFKGKTVITSTELRTPFLPAPSDMKLYEKSKLFPE